MLLLFSILCSYDRYSNTSITSTYWGTDGNEAHSWLSELLALQVLHYTIDIYFPFVTVHEKFAKCALNKRVSLISAVIFNILYAYDKQFVGTITARF
jgi:hypothetical protein